jgi:Fur family ferric uptake transcriptional regulator
VGKLGDPETLLRSRGLRVTQPRLAVVAVLESARREGEHLTAAEVVERTREILGRVSPQTVYDCLQAMTGAGVVGRVDLPRSPTRFEIRVDGHHHHVCPRCGTLRNVRGATAGPQDFRPDLPAGTEIDRVEVFFWGLCAACARRA